MTPETKFIKRPTERAAWLAARRGYVGGSEVAALCTRQPDTPKWIKTPVELWALKTGRAEEPESADSLNLEMGTRLEADAAEFYTRETGRAVRNFGYMAVRGHAIANVDRLIVPDGAKVASFRDEIRAAGIVECKDPGAFWGDGEPVEVVPWYYQAQAQLYAEILDLPFVDFAVLFHAPRWAFRIYRIERDRSAGAALLERIEKFWELFVATNQRPEPKTYADAQYLFPRSASGVVYKLDGDDLNDVFRLREIKAASAALEAEADTIQARLCAKMRDAEIGVDADGRKVVTWKTTKPRRVTDHKAVSEYLARQLGWTPDAVQAAVDERTTETPGARRFVLAPWKD